MDILDNISKHTQVDRIYYGDDRKNKPNEHCVWIEDPRLFFIGWHETDEHLRQRVLALINT